MSEHRAAIAWTRSTPEFTIETYNRDHSWSFDAGITVRASATPAYKGDADCVDPEEALVAAVASCHMLTFLAVAAKRRFTVDAYHDDAEGTLDKNAEGRLAITRITLRPRAAFSGDRTPTPEEIRQLHDQAHRACFIANSVKSEVTIEPAAD